MQLVRRQQAGTLRFDTSDQVEAAYAAMPWVTAAEREAIVLAWRTARAMNGEDAR